MEVEIDQLFRDITAFFREESVPDDPALLEVQLLLSILLPIAINVLFVIRKSITKAPRAFTRAWKKAPAQNIPQANPLSVVSQSYNAEAREIVVQPFDLWLALQMAHLLAVPGTSKLHEVVEDVLLDLLSLTDVDVEERNPAAWFVAYIELLKDLQARSCGDERTDVVELQWFPELWRKSPVAAAHNRVSLRVQGPAACHCLIRNVHSLLRRAQHDMPYVLRSNPSLLRQCAIDLVQILDVAAYPEGVMNLAVELTVDLSKEIRDHMASVLLKSFCRDVLRRLESPVVDSRKTSLDETFATCFRKLLNLTAGPLSTRSFELAGQVMSTSLRSLLAAGPFRSIRSPNSPRLFCLNMQASLSFETSSSSALQSPLVMPRMR
ncbi:hypothetical protein BC832DRAFT_478858 [Gaertneriomyces semiglobifer]|nr:hypothetical protein BC832DRAFT_478858 [Gaertneriomyces semiglobifer]